MKNPFKVPTAQQLAERELEDAKRQLLDAEAGLEDWTAKRDKLIKRVQRLEGMK